MVMSIYIWGQYLFSRMYKSIFYYFYIHLLLYIVAMQSLTQSREKYDVCLKFFQLCTKTKREWCTQTAVTVLYISLSITQTLSEKGYSKLVFIATSVLCE